MSKAALSVTAIMVVMLAGCASKNTRYEQCSSMLFVRCLDVSAQQCDDMFDKGHEVCAQKQQENTLFDTMPDSIREGYLVRCVADSLVQQSGLPEDRTKACLRW